MDIAEVGDVGRIGAIYWTFPPPDGRTLGAEFYEAVTQSFSIERQREQVHKQAAWAGFDIGTEIAIQFDHDLGLLELERQRLKDFLTVAETGAVDAVMIVAHEAVDRWRPNKVLKNALSKVTVLRCLPGTHLRAHFNTHKLWDRQTAARVAARRNKQRYQPSFTTAETADFYDYMAMRLERWPDWDEVSLQTKADRLAGSGMKTISGLRFTVERARDFEEGRQRRLASRARRQGSP